MTPSSKHQAIKTIPFLMTLAFCTRLALALAPAVTGPASADLPPRTPHATQPPVEPAKSLDGAKLALRVNFPTTIAYPWQEVWTVVQWQDEKGIWRDVEGWQGTLDAVEGGVGIKHWWVGQAHLGQGPFRWQIYRTKGGWLMATSEAFTLPEAIGMTRQIEVAP